MKGCAKGCGIAFVVLFCFGLVAALLDNRERPPKPKPEPQVVEPTEDIPVEEIAEEKLTPEEKQATTTKTKVINGSKSVFVQGYTRKDGTYVKPHYRSAPKR